MVQHLNRLHSLKWVLRPKKIHGVVPAFGQNDYMLKTFMVKQTRMISENEKTSSENSQDNAWTKFRKNYLPWHDRPFMPNFFKYKYWAGALIILIFLNEYCKVMAQRCRVDKINTIASSINKMHRLAIQLSVPVNEKDQQDIFDALMKELEHYQRLFPNTISSFTSSTNDAHYLSFTYWINKLLHVRVDRINEEWDSSLSSCLMQFKIVTDEYSQPMRIKIFEDWMKEGGPVHQLSDINVMPYHRKAYWRKYVPLHVYLEMIASYQDHLNDHADNLTNFGMEMKRVTSEMQEILFFFKMDATIKAFQQVK